MTVVKKKDKQFKTIWIRYDDTSSDRHQLFVKEHSIRNQEPKHPKGKTLFVLNIPPYATVEALKKIISDSCGAVQDVDLIQDSDLNFKSGYVIFAKEKGLRNILSAKPDFTLTLNTPSLPVLTGIEKWCKQYNESVESESQIQELIDQSLRQYDKRKEEEKKQNQQGRVDREGWMNVTGKKKRGQFAVARKESTIQKIEAKEESKKHKKQLLNFYTFQIREAKKENLAELRKKFELDKQKLERIKAQRKFKPF